MNEAAAAGPPLVEFDRVRKSFAASRQLLADLSFTVERGQFAVLTGGNGSGKSTVLGLIAGAIAPDDGRVRVAGEEPTRLRPPAFAALRRAMGIVPQEAALLADRSVLDNVMLPALVAGHSRRAAAIRAQAALLRVGLAAADEPPAALSAGARRLAALARAIVNRPALLLLDDTLADLDDAASAATIGLLAEYADAGVAVVVASRRVPPSLPDSARLMRLADGGLAG